MIEDDKIRESSVCKRILNEDKNLAVVATDNNIYKSELPDLENELTKTFIAVHNKRTKEIQLFQVTQASFRHSLYDNQRSMFEQNIVDSKKLLYKDYSGKKAATSYERNVRKFKGNSILNLTNYIIFQMRSIANSSLLENTIENTVDTLDATSLFEKDIFDKTQEERDEFRNSIFPQIKSFSIGKDIRELFSMNNLIGKDMTQHLAEVAIEVLSTASSKWSFKNIYIKNFLESIQNSKSPDSETNIKKASLLLYSDALTKLISKGSRGKKDLIANVISPHSYRLGQDVINKFTEDSKTASKFSKQKAIIYYTILMLMSTEKLEINLEDILDNVGLARSEFLKYAQIIGCKTKGNRLCISKANLDSSAKFNVPLNIGKKKKSN